MPIFISYTRKDRQAVDALTRDLERAHNEVWLDEELTGGQQWWSAILGKIRSCDLFIIALSPDSLKSRACRLEFDYALEIGRPLLPVLIRDVAINFAPPAIANTQIVDYRQRTIDAGIALVSAVASRPQAPPLPEPLPEPPEAPISYMHEYRDLVDAPFLTYQQQNHLLVDLRGYLNEDDDRETALDLMRALRQRRDIAESIGHEIDQLLAEQSGQQAPFQPPKSAQTPPPQPQASVQQPSPSPPQPPPFQPPQEQPVYQPPPQQQPVYQPPPQQQPGYQPSPQQQPGYQPLHGHAVGQPAPIHPKATIVLILGILGFLTCGITGIVAAIMGGRTLREIDAQPGRYSGRAQVNIGRILGWITVGLGALYLFLAFIGFLQDASYY